MEEWTPNHYYNQNKKQNKVYKPVQSVSKPFTEKQNYSSETQSERFEKMMEEIRRKKGKKSKSTYSNNYTSKQNDSKNLFWLVGSIAIIILIYFLHPYLFKSNNVSFQSFEVVNGINSIYNYNQDLEKIVINRDKNLYVTVLENTNKYEPWKLWKTNEIFPFSLNKNTKKIAFQTEKNVQARVIILQSKNRTSQKQISEKLKNQKQFRVNHSKSTVYKLADFENIEIDRSLNLYVSVLIKGKNKWEPWIYWEFGQKIPYKVDVNDVSHIAFHCEKNKVDNITVSQYDN
ncbi:hypothetical protein [Gaetbulibacter sp. PBL-D1]|uniref:hypothetical protein n=1 Tax=Gaetbulibacter sp. PBL-D1 TaxID=3422594 RepID=UPI003D2EAD15